MYSVILCGGSGSRLWPLSRKNFPKQFLKLYSDYSLLQETFLRMKKIMPSKNIFLVTNQENYFNVYNQIREIEKGFNEENVIVEPESLNTAPAIALAVKYLLDKINIDEKDPVVFLPSDHYISKQDVYVELVEKAMRKVGSSVGTIGITPTGPETGYGYIKKGKEIQDGGFYKVDEFKEKPDKTTAKKYLDSGKYVWNGGMYLFNADTFSKEAQKYAPEIYSVMQSDFDVFMEKFTEMPAVAIDVAISEKSDNIIVFEGEFGWSDIGSFDSLAEVLGDGGTKHVGINSNNVFVHSSHNRLVVTSDVDDLIIVENNDAILIQKKGTSENVKKVVEHLKEEKFDEVDDNIIVHKPWGKYEVLIDEKDQKVKKMTVYPGAKLSLQSHNHRAENWVVVKGMAKVVRGEEEIILNENESTFIPKNYKHRLENPGKMNLEIIEVQTGGYLEEDDIIRYDDIYKRVK